MRRCIFLIMFVLSIVPLPAAAQVLGIRPESETLKNWRAARREASRVALSSSDKSGEPHLSGLLVIPVDFSDARLPSNWDASTVLSPRLHPLQGETLHHYFTKASANNLDLRITLAPVVHLPGTRRDYSDRYLNGFTRTQALASEAITATKEAGLIFRSLDMEGPDRIPGSADDDGDLDGVLILHSGPGIENDPTGGWVQPLQFHLEVPIVSDGITASFYAVASMQSGLGIWAHETGHLLGLEDRYDPILHTDSASEIQSRGGLGRFSLMASGAWGTGNGIGCALPDAYSAIQLGWQQPILLPSVGLEPQTLAAVLAGGTCAKIWTEAKEGSEFFLLETRDPISAAPFDAAVPGNQLLVYHVDEAVPDGGWLVEGPNQYHLRVHLVEADGLGELRQGINDGNLADLFPGTTSNILFDGTTSPSSEGYDGPSLVSLTNITSLAAGVSFEFSAAGHEVVTFSSLFSEEQAGWKLNVEAVATGTSLDGLVCIVEAQGPLQHGAFSDGLAQTQISFSSTDGIHWVAEQVPVWIPDSDDVEGKSTVFSYIFRDPALVWEQNAILRSWLWGETVNVFDFATLWPGQWIVEHPGGNLHTTWHHWSNAPYLTDNQTPVLACTGSAYTSADNFYDTTYQNNAWTTLTSGPIERSTVGVRVIHAAEIEFQTTGIAVDGASLSWLGADGSEVCALPQQPWPASVHPAVSHVLRGQPTFGSPSMDIQGDKLQWRDDVFLTPEGPGPWRLKFTFASNTLWRFKGWFLASVESLESFDDYSLFHANSPSSDNSVITWSWPHDIIGDPSFQVQEQQLASSQWQTILEDVFEPTGLLGESVIFSLSTSRVFAALQQNGRFRNNLRIVGSIASGLVTSNTFVLYEDGGQEQDLIMAQPWPNPSIGSVKLDLNIPLEHQASLRIYDLAGRCVFSREFPQGAQFYLWDGSDNQGKRLSAGTYIIKLDGPGFSETNKVVLLH